MKRWSCTWGSPPPSNALLSPILGKMAHLLTIPLVAPPSLPPPNHQFGWRERTQQVEHTVAGIHRHTHARKFKRSVVACGMVMVVALREGETHVALDFLRGIIVFEVMCACMSVVEQLAVPTHTHTHTHKRTFSPLSPPHFHSSLPLPQNTTTVEPNGCKLRRPLMFLSWGKYLFFFFAVAWGLYTVGGWLNLSHQTYQQRQKNTTTTTQVKESKETKKRRWNDVCSSLF